MRVAVALSGGVDSAAAALLLKKAGHEVIGLHMDLHSFSGDAWRLAKTAAYAIGIPVCRLDLRDDFEHTVISVFLDEYRRGRTPSPCPICNRFMKAGRLLSEAKALGFDKLATGHYAIASRTEDGPGVFRGLDAQKDQTYFLFMLTQNLLGDLMFPLGCFTKAGVREYLRSEGLSLPPSPESQELCFIPGNDYREFLEGRGVAAEPGPIKDVDGKVLGTHRGVTCYTVGQRRGLGVCSSEPLYVLRLDPETNTLFVGPRSETLVSAIRLKDFNLITTIPIEPGRRLDIKVRSTARAAGCVVSAVRGREVEITLDRPQSGVAPGQAGVLYSGDRVIGGGWIEATRG
jgi:tRNA-specific 2-thiouridylase